MNTTFIKNKVNSRFWLGVLMLIFANIGFSSKAILIKLMYIHNISTISVIALRMFFSLPIFIVIAIWLAKKEDNVKLSQKDWLYISGLGILSYYISSMLDFLGLQYVYAGIERLILFTYPTMVVVLSAIIFKKKITPPQYFALILTYIGVGLIFVAEKGLGMQKNFWLGASLIFACAFTYSFYVIGTGEMVKRIGSVKFSCYAMIAATVPCIVQSYFYDGVDIFHFPKEVYFLTAWMVIFATVIPIFLIVEGIRIVGAGNSSIIGFSGPISTLILGYFFLGEQISFIQLIGTGIVLAGIFWVTVKK